MSHNKSISAFQLAQFHEQASLAVPILFTLYPKQLKMRLGHKKTQNP